MKELAWSMCFIASLLQAQTIQSKNIREFADTLHMRITGHQASAKSLQEMRSLIEDNQLEAAGLLATTQESFYSATLKSYYQSTTNEDYTSRAPLNDAVATIIGFVRDDKDFRELLYSDSLYIVDEESLDDYNGSNNDHYREADNNAISLKDSLTEVSLSATLNIPKDKVSGVLTSRAWGQAFYEAGTNRRVYQAILESFMCTSLEASRDVSIPDNQIRRDVSRAPAGDVNAFVSDCRGCHTHMDPATNAFNYFDYNEESGRLNYNPGTMAPKINLNVEYQYGAVPRNDQWLNMWQYSSVDTNPLGFYGDLPNSGYGPQGLGMKMAHSQAFNECAAKSSFEMVCFSTPSNDDQELITQLAKYFAENDYNFRKLVAKTAVECLISKWQANGRIKDEESL